MKRLVLFDLDGTLLNSRDEITGRTKKALMACQEKGIRLILASGRSYVRQMPYAKELKLREYGGCLIENNGLTVNDMTPGGRHKLAYLGAPSKRTGTPEKRISGRLSAGGRSMGMDRGEYQQLSEAD